jgi:DNA primase
MVEREKIDEIVRGTDIVGLISQYIALKKVGKNFRALCPFHTEKTPSFYVNPEKGIYYCFGCRKGGNALSFLMEYEHLDFPDALKKLARPLGIEIDTTKGLKHKELYDVNEFACQFFAFILAKENGKRGQNYLKDRKVDLEKIKEFRLGYAPSSGGLVTFMRQKGVALERLNDLGFVSSGREIFRDRLMFPIFSISGRVIGFGGRGIDDHIQPKYLNSPESPVFKKGEVLYGISQTKESIRGRSEAVLVEGYFDLLSLYQRGITNVCAPLGTALTESQCFLLSRYAKKVNILFDRDMSGIKAALRAVGLLINAQVDVHVTVLPEEFDPDEYIKEKGADEMNRLISEAPDFFHFYKDSVKTDTVESEVVLIKDLIQIINKIQDPIRFDRYLKYAARVFDIPADLIKKEMDRRTAPAVKREAVPKTVPGQDEKLLVLIFNNLDYLARAREIIRPEDMVNEKVRRVYEIFLKSDKFDMRNLAEAKIDERLRETLLESVMRDERLAEEDFVNALVSYRKNIEKGKIKPKIAEAIKKGDAEALKKYKEMLIEGK